MSQHPTTATYRLVGYDGVGELKKDTFVAAFVNQMKDVHKVILDNVQLQRGAVVNVVGMRQSSDSETSQLIAHLVQGWEAWCLDLICRDFRDVVCLIFDGWISGKRSDVAELEQRIAEESIRRFGLPLDIRIKEQSLA